MTSQTERVIQASVYILLLAAGYISPSVMYIGGDTRAGEIMAWIEGIQFTPMLEFLTLALGVGVPSMMLADFQEWVGRTEYVADAFQSIFEESGGHMTVCALFSQVLMYLVEAFFDPRRRQLIIQFNNNRRSTRSSSSHLIMNSPVYNMTRKKLRKLRRQNAKNASKIPAKTTVTVHQDKEPFKESMYPHQSQAYLYDKKTVWGFNKDGWRNLFMPTRKLACVMMKMMREFFSRDTLVDPQTSTSSDWFLAVCIDFWPQGTWDNGVMTYWRAAEALAFEVSFFQSLRTSFLDNTKWWFDFACNGRLYGTGEMCFPINVSFTFLMYAIAYIFLTRRDVDTLAERMDLNTLGEINFKCFSNWNRFRNFFHVAIGGLSSDNPTLVPEIFRAMMVDEPSPEDCLTDTFEWQLPIEEKKDDSGREVKNNDLDGYESPSNQHRHKRARKLNFNSPPTTSRDAELRFLDFPIIPPSPPHPNDGGDDSATTVDVAMYDLASECACEVNGHNLGHDSDTCACECPKCRVWEREPCVCSDPHPEEQCDCACEWCQARERFGNWGDMGDHGSQQE